MKAVVIGGVVLLAIFLVVLAFIPLGIEPLTEVYFENHTQLPSSVELGKLYNYSFSVHNLEHQRMRYVYTIDLIDENNTLLFNMDSGEFVLAHDESMIVDETFKLVEEFERARVQVNVTKDLSLETPAFKKKLWWPDSNYPMNVDIHFWIDEA
jgi:hypothetical protein